MSFRRKKLLISDAKAWGLLFGLIFLYLSVCVAYILILYKSGFTFSGITSASPNKLGEVIFDQLSNMFTIGTGVISLIGFITLRFFQKHVSIWKHLFICILLSLSVFINQIGVALPFSLQWLALFNLVIIVFLSLIVFFEKDNGLPASADGNKSISISNVKIIGVQLFSFSIKDDGNYVVYTLQQKNNFSRPTSDINGMLSGTYRISKQDETTFKILFNILLTYKQDGSDETKASLILRLEEQIRSLTGQLKGIQDIETINKDDCCKARLLMTYIMMLDKLKKDTPGSDFLEMNLSDNDLGVNANIAHGLFTTVRTGILGALLVGKDYRYLFSYRKGGYKDGRKYCASVIDASTLCLFVVKETSGIFIESTVLDAISDVEKRLEENQKK